MKRRFCSHLIIIIVSFSACMLLRCSSDENENPSNPNNPNEPGATVSDEVRLVVLEECRVKMEELNNILKLEDKATFVTWLLQKPEFQSAGLHEGKDVYAVFIDGRIVLFVNTPKTDDPSNGGRKRQGSDEGSRLSDTSGSKELPKSNKVSLYNGMGTYFGDNTVAIETIFKSSKSRYNVERKVGSIENLKQVSGAGVFYFYTHGSSGTIPILKNGTLEILYVPCFWTTDAVSADNERTYRTYLDEKKLAYMVSTFDNEHIVPHYGITDEFIRTHWSFSDNALIYMDACQSFILNSQKAQAFRDLIISKATNQKATYIGWSDITNEYNATTVSQFIFDRLLGTNTTGSGSTTIPKEDPIQRPFDLDRIFSDLLGRNFSVCANGATPQYETRVEEDIIITPSIERLEVSEYTSMLMIYGSFGSERGSVTIDGQDVVLITNWSSGFITCIIEEEGAGSAGEVIVSVGNLQSNPVPLTFWDIKLDYATDDNGIIMEGIITLKLRSDVHPQRTKPGENPSLPEFDDLSPASGFSFANPSSATYHISGQKYAYCNRIPCTNTFEETPLVKSGTAPYVKLGTTGNEPSLLALYNWTPDRKTIKLDILSVNLPDVTQTTYRTFYDCPENDEEIKNSVPTSMNFVLPDDQIRDIIKLEIADNYNIRAGSYSKTISRPWNPCDNSGSFTVQVNWELSRPKFEPTDTTPARMRTLDSD